LGLASLVGGGPGLALVVFWPLSAPHFWLASFFEGCVARPNVGALDGVSAPTVYGYVKEYLTKATEKSLGARCCLLEYRPCRHHTQEIGLITFWPLHRF
jgi:hypothetical protein